MKEVFENLKDNMTSATDCCLMSGVGRGLAVKTLESVERSMVQLFEDKKLTVLEFNKLEKLREELLAKI